MKITAEPFDRPLQQGCVRCETTYSDNPSEPGIELKISLRGASWGVGNLHNHEPIKAMLEKLRKEVPDIKFSGAGSSFTVSSKTLAGTSSGELAATGYALYSHAQKIVETVQSAVSTRDFHIPLEDGGAFDTFLRIETFGSKPYVVVAPCSDDDVPPSPERSQAISRVIHTVCGAVHSLGHRAIILHDTSDPANLPLASIQVNGNVGGIYRALATALDKAGQGR